MIPKSLLCRDLADNLHVHGDNTYYQASQGTMARFPVISTPDRVRRDARSHWTTVWDAYPPITSTPRSLFNPSTPFPKGNMQVVFSPSPLPTSPMLVYPEISPPSQGSGSTPFERQFIGDSPREWNHANAQSSPVLRSSTYYPSFFLSPTTSNGGRTSFNYDTTPPDSQGAVGRVSLIDKFISAVTDTDESSTTGDSIHLSVFSPQDRFSPLSDLSDLTSLSSSDDLEHGLHSRSSSPPTSPVEEKHRRSRRSNIQHSDQLRGSKQDPFLSPTRSSCSCDSDYRPAKGTTRRKRKKALQERDGDEIPRGKKKRLVDVSEPSPTDSSSSLETLTRRRLPTNVPYYSQFALLYLRFPVSSYLRLVDGTFPLLSNSLDLPAGTYNEPRDALDLYTPRFVRGRGATKVGFCPICIESPSRSGKGEAVWLSLKFSAYNYHLQYAHGISSISGRPFSPPIAFRTVTRQNTAKGERTNVQEGKCHKCKKWIRVESIKDIEIKVKELYWWKHAAACHQGTQIDGDDDFFLDDEIYRRAQQML